MSKFLERLRRAAEGVAQPIGFSPVARQRVAPLVLAAHLAHPDQGLAAAAVQRGAEFLLLSTADGGLPAPLPPVGTGEVPWGVRVPSLTPEGHQALKEAGCDFVVVSWEETPARLLSDEGIGMIATVALGIEDRLLRAVDQLPLEAVLVDAEAAGELTLKGLLEYAAIASGLGQALVAPVSPRWGRPELEQLREIGFSGLLVEVRGPEDLDGLQALRDVVFALPARPKRRDERSHARISQPTFRPAGHEEEEEEEDDDD